MKITFKTPEDPVLSPYTGWNRERWVELARRMIAAIQPYVTPGKGGLALPNPVRWQDAYLPEPEKMKSFYLLEGFTRTRLLLATYMVGTGETILEDNGTRTDLADQFIEGLLSASDPDHPEYIGDRYGNSQYIAETSGVALALYIARDIIWNRMTAKQRAQVSQWILATTGRKVPHNNWYLFVANTHCVLKALGEQYNQTELASCLEQIKDFYIGRGWFMDGDLKRGYSIDQYNAWGFHHFLPAYAFMKSVDQGWEEWILDRLRKYLRSFRLFFSANGSIPMWGRSWTYRPAMTAPFIWGELLGVSPLMSGETRRLVSGQMKYYLAHDYFQDDFTPTMGYAGENLELIEPYSQYGSPYWGSAVFLNLLLPPDHPFWQTKEEPLIVERESYTVAQPEIGLTVAGNYETGEVQIINHRTWHQKEGPKTRYAKKYTNFSYSSHFGIDLRRDERGYNCDSMFSISPNGKKFSQRMIPHFIALQDEYGASYHYPLSGFPFREEGGDSFAADEGIEDTEDRSVKITTQIYLKDFCQIRVYSLETKRKLTAVREGGFALNYFDRVPDSFVEDQAIAFWDGERGSFIRGLFGYTGPAEPELLLMNADNCHTLGGKSVTPTLVGEAVQPGLHVYVSLSGTWYADKDGFQEKAGIIRNVSRSKDGIIVEFADGSEYAFPI